ncbi:MAG: mechanosensitive ion channel [Phenylobacterium sp.]|jgi:hypothetical protein|uniref:mechanosensitive ion channel n=1 Tax=Phenylobacterium sp. TaxID=1871053 RepID=UPI00391CFF1C
MYPYDQITAPIIEWAPRVLGAVVVLIAAHFVGKAVQWGLARLINSFPGAKTHNRDAPPKETVGFQLGQLGYWLVILIGLIAALTILGLQGVVTPLNTLTIGVLAFVPNLVGAAVIFFVGLVLATIARRVVEAALGAAHVDAWLEKAGLSRVTGSAGLSRTLGLLVFVLIVIPVTIAALEQLRIAAISEPAVAVLDTVLSALPRLIAAAIILALAFFIGRWVASVIEQVLPSFGFDRALQGMMGQGAAAPPPSVAEPVAPAVTEAELSAPPAPSGVTPSKVVAQLALVAIMLFSAVEAARLLEFAAMALMLEQILELAAQVVFGGVIITVGVLLANFLARLIDTSTNGADGFASTLVRWATIALATAMGLRFMGIADEIVILAFGLILGSAAVAAALAFGIGGRETAHRLLERWTRKAEAQQRAGEPPTGPIA